MHVLVSGSTGLIGTALLRALRGEGHAVARLVRPGAPSEPGDVLWDPLRAQADAAALEGFDSIVHLAGENIASGRWTKRRKERLYKSRVDATAFLAELISTLSRPPSTFICASAIGYYGDRDTERLTESSAPGHGFLSDLCRAWEAASLPAAGYRTRVVNLRFGIVLAAHGGALARLLHPFRLGAGGVIGSGKQYVSWVALDDAVAMTRFAMDNPDLQGAVNAVAPQPVTNAEWTKALATVLSRPARLPLPAFLVKTLFGEMGKALLLSSQRAYPKQLMDAGYRFCFPRIEDALRHALLDGETPPRS